jgi:N-methylhydantoinase B
MSSIALRDLDGAAFAKVYGCSRFDATVLGNRFRYLLDHVSERLLACAFSPVLKDFYDFAATLTGPPQIGYPTPVVSKSQLAFTGTMTESIRNTIEEYGAERLGRGDVIIANDPYRTGTHVNDMLFIRPVFHGERLCGFVNLKAHQLDMGGSVAGGFSAHKFTTYENGLVLSPRALMKAGEPVSETWTLIFDNVRFGELLRLDMQTIIACLTLGESLLLDSIVRYGEDAVLGAMRYVVDADAERMADAIATLPDGYWQGAALVDCDAADDREEFPIRCSIRKHGSRLEVDLSGTARQARGAINGTYLDAKTTVGIALKYLLDPGGPFTSGCYRPVDIVIPDGAILSALPPEGVVFAYGESTNALLIAIFAALAVPLGTRAVGGDISAPNLHSAVGRRPDGSPWVSIVAGGQHGPWGATDAGDADSYCSFYQVNGMDTPIEAHEAEIPVVFMRRDYVTDSPGAGAHRGGAAVCKDTYWLEPVDHHLFTLRFKQSTGIGVNGGRDGTTGGVWLWDLGGGTAQTAPARIRGVSGSDFTGAVGVAGRLDPTTQAPRNDAPWVYFGRQRWHTEARATLRHMTNSGGGWGNPLSRPISKVLEDVRDGYISIAGAERDYGVVIKGDPDQDPEGLRVDEAGTRAARALAAIRR